MITVKLFANLREAAGGRRIVECRFDGPVSSMELMQRLVEDFGDNARRLVLTEDGTVRENILVMRNGEMLRDRDEKAISPGDEVAVLLPVAGG